jgi:hypothetical protein
MTISSIRDNIGDISIIVACAYAAELPQETLPAQRYIIAHHRNRLAMLAESRRA